VSRLLLAPLLLFVCFFLSSCVEGEEEVWINSDGSGRFIAHYEFPIIALKDLGDPDVFVEMIHKIDQREESIEIMDLYFVKKKNKAIFHLEASFEDAGALLELAARNQDLLIEDTGADPQQVEQMAGSTVFQLNGLTPTFHRTVILEGLIDQSLKGFLGRSNFKYTMHPWKWASPPLSPFLGGLGSSSQSSSSGSPGSFGENSLALRPRNGSVPHQIHLFTDLCAISPDGIFTIFTENKLRVTWHPCAVPITDTWHPAMSAA